VLLENDHYLTLPDVRSTCHGREVTTLVRDHVLLSSVPMEHVVPFHDEERTGRRLHGR
jgi:hypothetical protein